MRGFLCLVLAAAALCLAGCEGLPQPKEVDQGKVDRTMDQVEKGSQ